MFRAGTKRLRFGASFFSETAYFFPLCFPLTAFSEFYGILRASLESLENTTLFRRAFTPFYTPSLIQVPPRAPSRKPLKTLRFQGFCCVYGQVFSPMFSPYRILRLLFRLNALYETVHSMCTFAPHLLCHVGVSIQCERCRVVA